MLSSRYTHEDNSEAIEVRVDLKEMSSFMSALIASGFTQIYERLNRQKKKMRGFAPCPVGTFSNFSSKGAEGCIPCPPGMFLTPSGFLVLIPGI